jgi:hypothetical protein
LVETDENLSLAGRLEVVPVAVLPGSVFGRLGLYQ